MYPQLNDYNQSAVRNDKQPAVPVKAKPNVSGDNMSTTTSRPPPVAASSLYPQMNVRTFHSK
jgi:hypothetical protein